MRSLSLSLSDSAALVSSRWRARRLSCTTMMTHRTNASTTIPSKGQTAARRPTDHPPHTQCWLHHDWLRSGLTQYHTDRQTDGRKRFISTVLCYDDVMKCNCLTFDPDEHGAVVRSPAAVDVARHVTHVHVAVSVRHVRYHQRRVVNGNAPRCHGNARPQRQPPVCAKVERRAEPMPRDTR